MGNSTKRIILYIRKQEKWVQRRNGLVEVQKSTRSTRHCLQIRKIGSRPKGFHWNLYSSELGAIVIRLMRRKWNHAYAQDVRIAGECWHWLISWSPRLKLSKPYLTVSRYDYLLTVINGIALRLPFLTVISGVWRFNETTRCEADATTQRSGCRIFIWLRYWWVLLSCRTVFQTMSRSC